MTRLEKLPGGGRFAGERTLPPHPAGRAAAARWRDRPLLAAALVAAALLAAEAAPGSATPPTAAPLASPAHAAASSPATDAVPPPPPDLDRMLAAICGADRVVAAGPPSKHECKGVPAYPTPCDQPLAIGSMVAGSFTSPGVAEVLADYEGCEPHAANFGGSVLMRRVLGGWRRVAFLPGVRSASCLRFPGADGRHSLACFSSWTGQGEEDGSIQLLRFDAAAKLTAAELKQFHDVLWSSLLCRRGEVGAAHSSESFTSWERLDSDDSRPPRLLVHYRVQRFSVPDYCAAVPDNAAEDNPQVARFATWRATQTAPATLSLEWRAASATLVPLESGQPGPR